MIARMLTQAEDDLEHSFDYYQLQRPSLGLELLDEFRHGISLILEYPAAWQLLDATYHRFRLHRFPYGIVYRVSTTTEEVIIVAFMHLSQKPGYWKK